MGWSTGWAGSLNWAQGESIRPDLLGKSGLTYVFIAPQSKLQEDVAVDAVWLKLVSNCISLLTGKITAISAPFALKRVGIFHATC
jgi:hypothetical protein